MRLLTFMDMEEIAELTQYNDERINAAKERLAYEVTKLVHGEEKAEECRRQAKAAFSGDSLNMPTFEIPATTTFLPEILTIVKAAPSRGEARRLIEGGAVSVDDAKIDAANMTLSDEVVKKGEFVLHKGKKFHVKVVLK